jgi:hypothetical protein
MVAVIRSAGFVQNLNAESHDLPRFLEHPFWWGSLHTSMGLEKCGAATGGVLVEFRAYISPFHLLASALIIETARALLCELSRR